MKQHNYFADFCLWAIIAALLAQTPPSVYGQPVQPPFCGSDIIRHQLQIQHPHLQQLNELIDLTLAGQLAERRKQQPTPLNSDQSYSIPVVVHIVHNGGPENISDNQVHEAIRHINAAFSELRQDETSKVTIALCMAQQDEQGKATTGITRTQSALTDIQIETQDIALKNLGRWNTARYLNIWIVRSISSASTGPAVAGYSTLPSSHGNPGDGIVIEADYFGISPVRSTVGIHELGHYLGLYHTFDGGCGNDNCLLDGDRVCDTPPDASVAYTNCDQPQNSCFTDEDDHSENNPFRPVAEGGSGDQHDMITNFMDYSDLTCRQAFTPGQARRMAAVLTNTRISLLSSPACVPACSTPVTASFTATPTPVYAGETRTFTNTSTGATAYRWRANSTEFSTAKDASYTFANPGVYIITLEASNDMISCTRTVADTITVYCDANAEFAATETLIDPNTSVSFTNTSTGADTYEWYIDGQLLSTQKNYSRTFTNYGSHTVMLVAASDICSDTAYAFVTVKSCNSKHDNIWYFGHYVGLDFSTEPPTVLDNGAIVSHEGCATICNNEGQLLFYTNGETVWDRLHRIMPGGNQTLAGDQSAMRGVVIVPHPGNSSLYYIFTADAGENNFSNGMSYAIVDMERNNGAGEVIEVVPRFQELPEESVVATGHSNGRDFWVVVHNGTGSTGYFYSYLVSSTGLISTPVVSTTKFTGRSHYLKFSPSGTTLAVANLGGVATLYPFDLSTGRVSDAGALQLHRESLAVFGLEFSPDERFLYASLAGSSTPLRQYDLRAGSPGKIQASAVLIPETHPTGSLQLAPNGKIYVARLNGKEPGVIHEPNNKGFACGYQPKAINLRFSRQTSRLGLPNFASRRTQQITTFIAGPGSLCVPAAASYTLADRSFTALQWDHRGKGALSYSSDSSTVHLHSTLPGTDTLIALYSSGCTTGIDTMIVTTHPAAMLWLGPDTAICDFKPINLDAGAGFVSYTWQDGSTGRYMRVVAPGMYHVTALSTTGCVVSDSITVVATTAPPLDLGPNTTLCAGSILVFDAGPGFKHYRWQNGSTEQKFTVYEAGTYSVEAESFCGEIQRDTVVVKSIPTDMETSGDTTICFGTAVRLAATTPAASFLWSPADGLDDPTSATPTAAPSATTTYTVHALTAEGCAMQSSLTVTVSHLAAHMPPDTTICPGESVQLTSGTPGVSFLWSPPDGLNDPTSATPIATPTATTTYSVRSIDAEGCVATGSMTITVRNRQIPVVLRIPDTTAAPATALRIPVYLATEPGMLPLSIPVLRFIVRYRSALLQIHSISQGSLHATRNGDYDEITVELHNLAISNTSSPVAELIGDVFIGDSMSTALVIGDISADDCIAPLAANGRLAISDVCNQQMRTIRLRDTAPAILAVAPNPAGRETMAEVITSEEGLHTLALYNLQGQLICQKSFVHSGARATHTVFIGLQDIPAGLYQAVLVTPSQAVTTTLSVLE